jgi:hypothetical protein
VSAHWFDRLARSRAVSSQAGIAGSAGLTRRDALARAGAATLGLGALGAFGALPADASATTPAPARASDAQLAACGKCTKENDETANRVNRSVSAEFLQRVATPSEVGIGGVVYILELVTSEALRYAGLRKCAAGVCNPQSMSPAPSATPATEVETGAPICPDGTHNCGEAPGSKVPYCCFGTDLCCNGTCCIAEVGCACVG